MDTVIQAIEIFAAVTGVVYVILEILQKNAMWWVGILSGAACAFEFATQHIWASMGLNIYYMGMSVLGLIKWKKASTEVGEHAIHLNVMSHRARLISLALLVVGVSVFIPILKNTGDAAPVLDGTAVTLSVIATWWLTQSYLEQWMLWIVTDLLNTALCLTTGQYWMAAMYMAYIASAVYGYFHWKNHGKYVNLKD